MVDEPRKAASPINTALLRTSWRDLIGAQPSLGWYGPLLTRVVLLVADGEVQYVTGTLRRNGIEDFTGAIYVFTVGRVIIVEVSGDAIEVARSTVRSYRRSSLAELEVDAEASVFGDLVFEAWPGSVTVTARYENGDVLTLPAEEALTSTPREETIAFLPSLIADLD